MNLLRILAMTLLSGPAWADVQVNLSQDTLTQGQPFRIGFEAQGAGASLPDLGPLGQDFEIVQRNSGRSSRNINGQVSQRTTLNLTLVPKRAGDLDIPALSFGQERSAPVRIKVAAGTGAAPPADPGGAGAFPPRPGFSQSFSYSTGGSSGPGPGGGMSGPPNLGGMSGGLPGWGSGGLGSPPWGGMPGTQSWLPPAALTPPLAPESAASSPPAVAGEGPGYWPWLAALAVTGWLLTALAWWRVWTTGRLLPLPRPLASPASPPQAVEVQAAAASNPATTPVTAPDPLDEVRRAYGRDDPFAAKDALLRWASRAWPADPPSNLSRLAVRCPPSVQRHLLKLDEALYSPTPVAWQDPALLEQLVALGPANP